MVKRPNMSSKLHATLESSLFRLHPSRILSWSRGRKCFPSDWGPLETSLFRLHQIAFSASPESENKLRMPFESLKHRFFDIIQIVFWYSPPVQNKYSDMRDLETPLFLPHPSRILGCQEAENEFKRHATPWHTAFLTSPTLHFGVVKRNKMSLQ